MTAAARRATIRTRRARRSSTCSAAERIDIKYASNESKLWLLNEVEDRYDHLVDTNLTTFNPAVVVQGQDG